MPCLLWSCFRHLPPSFANVDARRVGAAMAEDGGPAGTASNFISKTYQMLQDVSNRDAIRWGANGASLIIDLVRAGLMFVTSLRVWACRCPGV